MLMRSKLSWDLPGWKQKWSFTFLNKNQRTREMDQGPQIRGIQNHGRWIPAGSHPPNPKFFWTVLTLDRMWGSEAKTSPSRASPVCCLIPGSPGARKDTCACFSALWPEVCALDPSKHNILQGLLSLICSPNFLKFRNCTPVPGRERGGRGGRREKRGKWKEGMTFVYFLFFLKNFHSFFCQSSPVCYQSSLWLPLALTSH